MVLFRNKSLQSFNTFGIPVKADNLIKIGSERMLRTTLKMPYRPFFVLGGGSNILFTKDVKGFILKNEIRGIEIEKQENQTIIISVGGGESWHLLVLWCIRKGFGGIENLSLIPGTVGAAPIQNIGAYGVELKDVFEKLEAIELSTGKKSIFDKIDCQFGYRDSIFKNQLKGQFFITKVYLRLSTTAHQLHTYYGAIRQQLQVNGILSPTIKDISDAVIQIRSSKLPNPKLLGNAGSFFKNPTISSAEFLPIKEKFPSIVAYELPNDTIKIAAGWLIEQCGWKGKRVGNTGAYKKQALVLVNYGNATGAEVQDLVFQIIDSVQDKFGITLTPEVNII